MAEEVFIEHDGGPMPDGLMGKRVKAYLGSQAHPVLFPAHMLRWEGGPMGAMPAVRRYYVLEQEEE